MAENRGVKLPAGWHEAISERLQKVFGKNGFGQYVWMEVALRLLETDEDEIRNAGLTMRNLVREHPDLFESPLDCMRVRRAFDLMSEARRAIAEPPHTEHRGRRAGGRDKG